MPLLVNDLRTALLAAVHLTVGDGEVVAVEGPSGSGKTLLLRAIADLDPSDGEVSLDGVSRDAMSGPAWRRRVRYVAGEPGWWAETVGAHFRDPAATAAAAAELLLPADCMAWPVARLSSGERQRLGLLRSLQDDPRVLLLDEPTGALDEAAEAAVEAVVRGRLAAGACVLLVSHSAAQIARLADRRLAMLAGRLVPAP